MDIHDNGEAAFNELDAKKDLFAEHLAKFWDKVVENKRKVHETNTQQQHQQQRWIVNKHNFDMGLDTLMAWLTNYEDCTR